MFLFRNDLGVDVLLLVTDQQCKPLSLVTTTAREFEFTKPDGTIVTKTAAFVTDGSDGRLRYATEAGFLDVVGTWKVRAKLTEAAKLYRTEPIAFAVKA